jgi:hypothetical protein
MEIDWVAISASVIAFLSWRASVASARTASKSADIAVAAEARARAGERTAAIRELMRTAGAIESQGRLAVLALEDASRSAVASAEMHGTPDGKRQFLIASNEFQGKIMEVKERANHGIQLDAVASLSSDQIFAAQLRADQVLGYLQVDIAFANKRAEQLMHANRGIGDDLRAAERAEGIFVRRNHEGKLG